MPADRGEMPRRPVGSVARATQLLDELAASETPLGVNELARRIGVNASTASRLLATLQDAGLVMRTDSGPYRLGLKLVTLSDRVLASLDVRGLARPLLARLVAETGETATLSVPGETEAITVDFVPSPSSVVSMARVGRPSVSHATAAGKVMLAYAGGEAAGGRSLGRRRGAGPVSLTAFTPRTITDPAALAAELDTVRARGWAEAVGEREADLAALAAPAFGRYGELAAILGVQGPVSRLPVAARRSLREPLLVAAADLSARPRGQAAPVRASRSSSSAPGVGAMRHRVQVPGGKALVAERVQQRGVLALQDAGDLLADGDHLVAVVGVGGHEHVGAHVVEHREVVDGEGADPARADLAVLAAGALEALQAVRQRRRPHVGEPGVDGAGGVGVDVELGARR